jgi:hypothetical protein
MIVFLRFERFEGVMVIALHHSPFFKEDILKRVDFNERYENLLLVIAIVEASTRPHFRPLS